jgi:hypothetical protein
MNGMTGYAALLKRLEALESQVAIRALMADYMQLCDHLDGDTPMARLGELFTEDAVWQGIGGRYGAAFGAHHGRAAIVAMLNQYREPPHFIFNAHYLTSERIETQGAQARGQWMMLQTSTYRSGASDLRSAHLSVAFRRSTAGWQIARFETENLFSRPTAPWNDPTPIPLPEGVSR